jgi:hypothetical protein
MWDCVSLSSTWPFTTTAISLSLTRWYTSMCSKGLPAWSAKSHHPPPQWKRSPTHPCRCSYSAPASPLTAGIYPPSHGSVTPTHCWSPTSCRCHMRRTPSDSSYSASYSSKLSSTVCFFNFIFSTTTHSTTMASSVSNSLVKSKSLSSASLDHSLLTGPPSAKLHLMAWKGNLSINSSVLCQPENSDHLKVV